MSIFVYCPKCARIIIDNAWKNNKCPRCNIEAIDMPDEYDSSSKSDEYLGVIRMNPLYSAIAEQDRLKDEDKIWSHNKQQNTFSDRRSSNLIQKIAYEHAGINLLTCPKCFSTHVTTGTRGVNGLFGFIGASKTVNRCGECGHTWRP